MFTTKYPLTILACILLLAFLLAACTSPAQPQRPPTQVIELTPVEPTETPQIEIEPTLSFVTHEGARDIAVAHLVEKYSLDAPGEWTTEDKTPQNLVGSSAFLYTSGAWVVHVQAPVVAPEYLVYTLKIDHIASGLHWEGEVDADGSIKELMETPPAQVLSPLEARQVVVEFLIANHGWSQPGEWTEQQPRPMENAVTRYTYVSNAWVVQVDAPAAAPIIPEYTVTADHMSSGSRWTGSVRASGEISEGS